MKENSQDQSFVGFVLALIIYLFIGLMEGKEKFWGIVMWIAMLAAAVLIAGVVAVLLETLEEKNLINENKKTLSN